MIIFFLFFALTVVGFEFLEALFLPLSLACLEFSCLHVHLVLIQDFNRDFQSSAGSEFDTITNEIIKHNAEPCLINHNHVL
jgi:hypothetical protein